MRASCHMEVVELIGMASNYDLSANVVEVVSASFLFRLQYLCVSRNVDFRFTFGTSERPPGHVRDTSGKLPRHFSDTSRASFARFQFCILL